MAGSGVAGSACLGSGVDGSALDGSVLDDSFVDGTTTTWSTPSGAGSVDVGLVGSSPGMRRLVSEDSEVAREPDAGSLELPVELVPLDRPESLGSGSVVVPEPGFRPEPGGSFVAATTGPGPVVTEAVGALTPSPAVVSTSAATCVRT